MLLEHRRDEGQGEERLFWGSGENWSCLNPSLPQKGTFAELTPSLVPPPLASAWSLWQAGVSTPPRGCFPTAFQAFPISTPLTIFR